jgi:HPt (histidine-containing phosphotransfer) domain-containing protein
LLTNDVKQSCAGAPLRGPIHRVFASLDAGSRPRKTVVVGEQVMAAVNLKKVRGPDQTPAVLDEAHLARMTLGDRQLERDVLQIFVRQAAMMLERIATAEPPLAAAAAHTLVGSARGIGAWRVAHAAERLERACMGASRALECDGAVEELRTAALEASAAIGTRLGGVLRDH